MSSPLKGKNFFWRTETRILLYFSQNVKSLTAAKNVGSLLPKSWPSWNHSSLFLNNTQEWIIKWVSISSWHECLAIYYSATYRPLVVWVFFQFCRPFPRWGCQRPACMLQNPKTCCFKRLSWLRYTLWCYVWHKASKRLASGQRNFSYWFSRKIKLCFFVCRNV